MLTRVTAVAALAAFMALNLPALAQSPAPPPASSQSVAAPIDARKAIYAPWSPDQMVQRRKEQGLKGPGVNKP
ncbi:MAG: hypothetical protein K2X62_12005, partial [Beijerinckiaceae bacterium]|nr:hypothetical protein [Beijerinckiaceae bacterium]